jgi:hypothetical protein
MTESAGVFDLDLVAPCDDLDLLEASLLGSDRATAILWDVAQTNTDQRIPSAVPVLPPGVTFVLASPVSWKPFGAYGRRCDCSRSRILTGDAHDGIA